MEVEREVFSGPSVAVDPEGFSIAWTERTPVPDHHVQSDHIPVVARFSPDGRPVAAPFRLFGEGEGDGWVLQGLDSSASSSVVLLSGGRNSVQLFSPGGDPAGRRVVVGKRAPCLAGRDWCEQPLTVAMDSSGRFAVVWLVSRYLGTEAAGARHDLLAQLFDAEGRPLGERVQVNRDYEGFDALSSSAAVLSDDGVLTFVWEGRRRNGSSDSDLVFRQEELKIIAGKVAPYLR